MRLDIFTPTWEEQKWWLNFRLSLDSTAWPVVELEKMYRASIVSSIDEYPPYIKFKTEQDCMLFLLRWA